jgi:precorrin-2 dehydrogenase / sirohydrochlorin ferrochelatase
MKNRRGKTNSYYPLFINLRGKKCVVIGGGAVALRKVIPLLECGAKVTVVSPGFIPELKRLKGRKAIVLVQRSFNPEDLKGAAIVIAATDSKEINQEIAERGKKQGALVNVVDDPEDSDFIVPSFFRRGDLTLAVSTGGASPALARKVRTWLEENIGEDYRELLSLVKEVRGELIRKKRAVSPETWQEGLDLDLLIGFLKAGQKNKARKMLLKRLLS